MTAYSDKSGQLDRFDIEIIKVLGREGRLPVTELSARVGLSKTPCQVRLKRLISDGYIKGFKAILDPVKLGAEQVVFIEVKLNDTSEAALTDFNNAVQSIAEVEQCHLIAGAFDYLLKLRTEDMRSYREILGRMISTLPHVNSTSTHVSMQSVKDNSF